jgi:hypothetical protein
VGSVDQWYVAQPDGEPEGPLDTADIIRRIRKGGVDQESKVCPAGGSVWVSMSDVPDFDRALRRAPTMLNLKAPTVPGGASQPFSPAPARAMPPVSPLEAEPAGPSDPAPLGLAPAAAALPAVPPLAPPAPAEDTIRPPVEIEPELIGPEIQRSQPPSPLDFGLPPAAEPARMAASPIPVPRDPPYAASLGLGEARPSRIPPQLQGLPTYWMVAAAAGLLMVVGAVYTLAKGGERGLAVILVGLGGLIVARLLQQDPTVGGRPRR